MARKTTKTVTKTYESDKIGAWDLNYEHESENGEAPAEIKVTGSNGNGGSFYYSKTGTNLNISFSGAEQNDEVIASVVSEVPKILKTYEKAAK